MDFDANRGWKIVQARLDRTTNPRHRQLLEVLRDHLKAEVAGDFDLLMSTLAADPEYKFWVAGNGFGAGPKGRDAVAAHYQNLYVEGRHVCQFDIDRIVVDDDCVVTEGWFKQLYPGWVLALRNAPIDDESAVYVVTMRLTLFWPYDEAGKLIGEDSYSDGEMFRSDRIQKLDAADVPAEFFQRAS
jgi:hypothetical protein